MNNTKLLQGKIALVTGVGRSAGIGVAIFFGNRQVAVCSNGRFANITIWKKI